MDKNEITSRLMELCQQEGVKCLYAVESGSRAWGFASPDSDYDVRFVYIRPKDDYLKIDRPRGVIEYMGEDGLLDMAGWDTTKTLKLLKKSNPSAVEWLSSQEIYFKHDQAFQVLNKAMLAYFDQYR